MRNISVLFITKSKTAYGTESPQSQSTGLQNSSQHVLSYLESVPNLSLELRSVIDNNGIDKEVHAVKPDIVIIEALWVVPDKFEVLRRLHPRVKWIVRLHSNAPFIAGEGIAFDWITRYLETPDVYVACNSKSMQYDLEQIFLRRQDKILYLPNIYHIFRQPKVIKSPIVPREISIGCFGAIRVLKNQLTQALAAIAYADSQGYTLNYHINASRAEGYSSDNILKNIRALFDYRCDHKLIEHEWMCQSDFKDLIKTLDIGLQVSFTETFNMVSGDFIASGVPIVVSEEIEWVSTASKVNNPSNTRMITKIIERTLCLKKSSVLDSLDNLDVSNKSAKKAWINTLTDLVSEK